MNYDVDIWNVMPWYWVVLLVVVFISALAILGFFVQRRLFNIASLKKNQAIASYALNTIALLYCVIVGFVVIRAQERTSTVKEIVVNEANLLLNLYYTSCDVFPPEVCHKVRSRIRSYVKDVIEKEWPLMCEGKDIALAFPKSVHELWRAYDKFSPQDIGQAARYQECLSRLNELSQARFGRLSNVGRSEGTFMWAVLIYGGILVIISTYLFVYSDVREHVMQLLFISSFIALVLLLIYSLDSPYSGPTAIKNTPFLHVMELMDDKHRVEVL